MNILSHLDTRRQNSIIQKAKVVIRALLGLPLTIVSLYFLFSTIYSQYETIIANIASINILLLILGLLLFSAFFFIKTYIWYKLLPPTHKDVTKIFYDYQLSEIARYAPFNILSFVSRINRFETKTVDKKKLLKLMGLEITILVLGAFLISLPSIAYFIKKYTVIPNLEFNSILVLIAITILLWMFMPSLLRLIFRFVKTNFSVIFFSIISWLCYALASYFVAIAVVFLDPFQFTYLLSLFTLGWLIGFLSFVAPMGIGVREFVVVFGLSGFASLPAATLVVIIQRLTFTLSEVINIFLTWFIMKNNKLKACMNYIFAYRIEALVAVCATSYISYFSFLSIEKHNNFFTGRFDLGNMDQTVWNTINGRIFLYTNPDGTETVSRLSAHADFILILLSPLYLLWSDPRLLLIIQSIVIGCGVFFVFAISNYVLKNKHISLVFSLSYLLNPFVQRQNVFDFHAVSLATMFLLATFYFFLKKRFILFSIFLILALFTKEHMYLIAFFFGCYLFIKGYKKTGMILAALSLIIFYILITILIPNARGGLHFALSFYQDLGDSPMSIIKTLLTDPKQTINILATAENNEFIHNLFLPVGYTVLFAPAFLLFPLADFAISLLSSNNNFKSIHYHYAAAIIPFVYISAIYGYKKLLSYNIIRPKLLIVYIVICTLYSIWMYGVLPGTKSPQLDIYTQRLSYREDIYDFIKSIPKELSVATTNNIGAHFSQREHLYTLPQGLYTADIVVFLLTDKYSSPSIEELYVLEEELAQNPSYVELIHIENFRAFAKRSVALHSSDRIAIREIEE